MKALAAYKRKSDPASLVVKYTVRLYLHNVIHLGSLQHNISFLANS